LEMGNRKRRGKTTISFQSSIQIKKILDSREKLYQKPKTKKPAFGKRSPHSKDKGKEGKSISGGKPNNGKYENGGDWSVV